MAYGDGTVFQRKDSSRWWISYLHGGKRYCESGGLTEAAARKKLRARLTQLGSGSFIGPQAERLTVGESLDAYDANLERRAVKSLYTIRCALKSVREAFGTIRASALTTQQLEVYQTERLQTLSPQTVDHELTYLRAAYRLAHKRGVLGSAPHFPMLRADNRRTGFFEKEEVEKVIAGLPAAVADVTRFAYLSGWRRGEIVSLRWEQVDRSAGEVRLHTSKSGRPRTLPLEGELRSLIEKRWAARTHETANGPALSPLVFHDRWRRVGDFRKVWWRACVEAGVGHYVKDEKGRVRGYVGKIFHDLRRSAVRDMIRAGVPQSVAMSISGHVTASVFLRYDIASDTDRREALRKVQRHRAEK